MLKNSSFVCLGAKRIFDITLVFEDDETCRWIDEVDHRVYFTLRKNLDHWMFTEENCLGLTMQRLEWNHSYPIRFHDEPCLLYITHNDPAKQQFHYYRLPDEDEIVIGRKKGDIRFDHPLVSAVHAKITVTNGQCMIEDLGSANGVYVNQQRVMKSELKLGDCIYVMGLQLLIGNRFLAVNQQGESLHIKARLPPYEPKDEKICVTNFPRMRRAKPQEYVPYQIETRLLKEAPPAVKQDRQPLLYLLGPSLTMSAASGCSSLFMVQNLMANGQPLISAMPSLVMAGSMLIGSLLWPVLTRRYEVRKEWLLLQKREAVYDVYLRQQDEEVQQCLQQAVQKLKQLYISENDAIWPYEFTSDQLYLCLGVGDRIFKNPCQVNEQPLKLEKDALEQKKQDFLARTYRLEQVPMIERITKLRCFQILGSDQERRTYAQYLLYHHALLYAPNTTHILIACTKSEEAWIPRFLPHLFHESEYRFLCTSLQQLPKAFMYLHQDYLPVLALSFAPSFTAFMQQNGNDLPMALFAFHEGEFTEVLNLKNNHGSLSQQSFQFEDVHFSATMNQLCNIDMHAQKKYFPKQLGFLAMYQVSAIKQLQISKRWYREVYEPSLQAHLGVREDGEILSLDLHERIHGPHGIVAGMTGSGKSELLITMLLSLAVNYHPYVCSFILIDYKGGGMAKALAHLPHLAGVITNLDGAMIERSLTSLHVELLRRQRLFAQVMESGGYPSMDIDVYQRLYHEHKVTEIVPHLVIAADEFAELKQQEPQFMEQLIRIARIGRSLGIHLILATQKPSGIVDDQIWSNARFHICLKVAEQNDSMDMLKRKESAQIKAVGRFYLQVGYDEVFVEGQSAYAKLPYDPDQQGIGSSLIKELANDGSVQREWQRAHVAQIQSEMNAVIAELAAIAEHHRLKVPRLWQDPLPDEIWQADMEKGCFALADDPENQSRFSLSIKDHLHNCLFLGHDLNAVRKALHAILYALCSGETNERIVIIDGANGKLCKWKQNTRIFAAVTPEESDDLRYLMQHFYRLRKNKPKEQWLLIIHNVAALLEAVEDAGEWLAKLARDHGSNGIHLFISAMTLTDLSSRLFQQFENLFVFHLQDEQEARSLVQTALGSKPPLRAIHKHQEQLYTVQFFESRDVPGDRKGFAQLPPLEEAPVYEKLADEVQDGFVIGRSLDERKAVALPFEGCYIITGYEWQRVYQLMREIAAIKQYPITFSDQLDAADDEGMCIIALSPQDLSMNFSHPLLQECKAANRILWCGLGLSEFCYLWNLGSTFHTDKKTDICLIRSEPLFIRGICSYD